MKLTPLPAGRGWHLTFDGVSFADAVRRLRTDAGFRADLTAALAALPAVAFRWETPPVTAATAGRPFECAVLASPGLARTPDPDAFAEHFSANEPVGPERLREGADTETVVAFPNLGGDAILVVPCPVGPVTAYGHLAAFVRSAPASQIHSLWAKVGEAMDRRVGPRPVWLSTAGAGVAWLHVRLDDRPKYYGHEPFRTG